MKEMTMKQIQNLLQYHGYYEEIPDGIYGPETEQATLDFQKAYGGIKVDGIPGEETQAALKHAVAYGMPVYEASEDAESGDFWDEIEFFERDEFACTCKGRYCDGFPVEPDEKLVRLLDTIRRHYGVPISPNSAIRCPQRNAELPGASSKSQHMNGKAADISVPGVSPEDLYAYAESLMPDTGGLGIYEWGIHIDTRTGKSRWDSR